MVRRLCWVDALAFEERLDEVNQDCEPGEVLDLYRGTFLSEDEVPYQAKHSYIAIATGGVAGKGPGNSDQRNFLPHPYSDFIFAIIIEEYGLIGGAFIVFIYLVFLYRSIRLFKK